MSSVFYTKSMCIYLSKNISGVSSNSVAVGKVITSNWPVKSMLTVVAVLGEGAARLCTHFNAWRSRGSKQVIGLTVDHPQQQSSRTHK